jgi:hypothetical protein
MTDFDGAVFQIFGYFPQILGQSLQRKGRFLIVDPIGEALRDVGLGAVVPRVLHLPETQGSGIGSSCATARASHRSSPAEDRLFGWSRIDLAEARGTGEARELEWR